MVPVAALTAIVVAVTCPDANNCTRLFPQSATYKLRFVSTKIPRGLASVFDDDPEHSVPAATIHKFELVFSDFEAT
jgi:hypothetical protein